MLIDSEIQRYLAEAPPVLAKNVECFLNANGIVRGEFEKFALRPFKGNLDPFYVSTIARGLAGSKSDLDLLLVSDGPLVEGTTLSNMLFHAGRRVGVKLIDQPNMASSLAVLEQVSARIAAGLSVSAEEERKGIAIGWQDLERLVNGISFVSGARYLRYLSDLCRWMVVAALQEFEQQVSCARLALASENLSAASAYSFAAVVSAMDAVMAACGQVQSNTKWTFERWRNFTSSARAGEAQNAITQLSQAKKAVARSLSGSSAIDVNYTVDSLHGFLRSEFVASRRLGTARLDIAGGTHRLPFLPGAEIICGQGISVVVDAAALEEIVSATSDDVSAFSGVLAKDALRLLQVGALSYVRSVN